MGRVRRPGAPTRALSMGPNKRICGKQALFHIKRLGRPAAAVAGDQLEPLDTTHRLFLGSIRPQEVLTDLAENAVSSGVEFGACLKEYAPSLASISRTHHHEVVIPRNLAGSSSTAWWWISHLRIPTRHLLYMMYRVVVG